MMYHIVTYKGIPEVCEEKSGESILIHLGSNYGISGKSFTTLEEAETYRNTLTAYQYKRGQQTAVYNSNSQKWQVQTWTGTGWLGFVDVDKSEIAAEKQRQLIQLKGVLPCW
jgi:hypothetical protein